MDDRIFYSVSIGGFYSSGVHGDELPSDAKEISREEYDRIFAGQAAGMAIEFDAIGPRLVAPPPPVRQSIIPGGVFRARFTREERLAWSRAIAERGAEDDALAVLSDDASSGMPIDLDDDFVFGALNRLVEIGVLSNERRDEIRK